MNKLHSGCGIHIGILGIDHDIAIGNRTLLIGIAIAAYGIPSAIALLTIACAIGPIPTTTIAILMATAVGYGMYRIMKTIRNAQPPQ